MCQDIGGSLSQNYKSQLVLKMSWIQAESIFSYLNFNYSGLIDTVVISLDKTEAQLNEFIHTVRNLVTRVKSFIIKLLFQIQIL